MKKVEAETDDQVGRPAPEAGEIARYLQNDLYCYRREEVSALGTDSIFRG